MTKANERLRRGLQVVVVVAILGAGAAVTTGLMVTKPVPARHDAFARVLQVDVMSLAPRDERFPIIGHGTVRPQNQVEVVPLVNGKLVYSHEDLARGKVIPEGELLFEIDPTMYEARVLQGEAEVRRLETALEKHDQELADLQERIETAKHMLSIYEAEYLTSKRLFEEERSGTSQLVHADQLKYLSQKDAVNELQSRYELIPLLKRDTQAQLDAATARLKQSRYEKENTKITCPFDARVEAVHARRSQVVTAHLSIATLTDMSAFELSVGIDPDELFWLHPTVQPEALDGRQPENSPPVKVRWASGEQEYVWKGEVARFEQVDERTRTAQMVVEVHNVDMVARVEGFDDTVGPSISIGMFCTAELPARPLNSALIIPRHSIYENRWVYVVEPSEGGPGNGRLARRQISLLRTVGDDVVVDFAGRGEDRVCELQPDDQLVVSRLTKPVIGMEVQLRDEHAATPPVLEGEFARLPDPIECYQGQPADVTTYLPAMLSTYTPHRKAR